MWYAGAVEALFEATATGRTMAKGRSLSQFQEAFPDEASCAAFLSERRWPEGFVCPGCGEQRAAALKSRAYTYECLDCGRQTSATAGTVMHRSKLPLTTWFWAAHLMATHSNGMSARQLEDQLGVTYKTAWLLTQKLRRSMVDPDRDALEGVVEVDQAEVPFREGDAFFEPGNAGKILVAGAVEVIDRDTNQPKPRRKHAKYLDTRSGRIRGFWNDAPSSAMIATQNPVPQDSQDEYLGIKIRYVSEVANCLRRKMRGWLSIKARSQWAIQP